MSSYVTFLDANVLVPACLRDTLLRQAEEPRLFIPKWSDQVIDETLRTLETKLSLTVVQTRYLVEQLKEHFPEAWVEGFESLIPAMQNHAKDKHVLAAAAKSRAEVIVTFNVKHFPNEALEPWGIVAQHPDDFLVQQYDLEPELVQRKLALQAEEIGRSLGDVLAILKLVAPRFARLVSASG